MYTPITREYYEWTCKSMKVSMALRQKQHTSRPHVTTAIRSKVAVCSGQIEKGGENVVLGILSGIPALSDCQWNETHQ